MGRIFYHRKDGTIYGTHPGPHEHLKTRDGRPKIELPDGIAWIDVPEAPPLIPWPARDGQPGREQWSRVVAGALVLRDDLPPIPPDPDAELTKAVEGVDTSGILDPATKRAVDDLKAALLGAGRAAKVKGRPA